jgi:predicted small integral membrane protein
VSYSPILIAHIFAGTFGLLSGTAAMFFRKGSPRHVLAGRIFVASMLTMGVLAVYLAIVRHQPNNIGGGILTVYLIGTGWLTARRKDGEACRFDWVLLLIPLTLGILTWMNGLKVVRSGASSQDGVPVGMTFFMGSVMLLASVGDVRMLVRGGVFGAKRIARHLWRMCFGLFIAAGSFFLGPSNRPLRLLSAVGLGQHLSPALFSTPLYLFLSVLPLVLLIFWLVRVRFRNAYQGSIQLASASPDLTLTKS